MEPNGTAAAGDNGTAGGGGPPEGGPLLIPSDFGTVLSVMYVAGVAGNVYTLVVMCHLARCAAPMYSSIVSLALADLLYLSTIPFIGCTYLAQDWYFGDLGCRILLSLDLLTMHASIFTLTLMCTERYLAVTRPLDTLKRSRGYRKVTAGAVWSAKRAWRSPLQRRSL